MRTTQSSILLLQLYVAFLLITGCGDANKNANNNLQPTFTSLYTNLFSVSCKNCHLGAGSSSGVDDLDFSSLHQAYADIFLAVRNPSNPSQCNGLNRVVRSQPSTSFVLGLLIATYNVDNFGGVSGCKPSTDHLTSLNLSESEKSTIIRWIESGAPL